MKPLTPTTPHVIIMVGIPGAGKTTFAAHFAKTFHAPYINPLEIAEQAKLSAAATVKVTEVLFNELLKTNQTLIYEGPTHTKIQRLAVLKKVVSAGYKPLLVWVQTESVEAKRRATKKQLPGSISADVFDAAIKRFQPPTAVEKAVVISGKHTYATQVKAVLKHLAGARTDVPIIDKPRPTTGRNIVVR